MKYKILLITLIAALGVGCNSAYRSTQTPDDVYYSPVRPMGEEESKTDEEDKRYSRKTARSGCRGTTGGGGNLTMITIAGTILTIMDTVTDITIIPIITLTRYSSLSPVKNPKNSTPRMTNLSSYQYQTITTTNPRPV